jgi:hypothetical protein
MVTRQVTVDPEVLARVAKQMVAALGWKTPLRTTLKDTSMIVLHTQSQYVDKAKTFQSIRPDLWTLR